MAIERILMNGVTEILQKLVPVVAQEIGSAWGVKDELKKLQRTLEMILAVIADAERKQVTDEAVRLWLRWLRDVVYDADDVMDEFSYETMRLRERNSLKHKVRDFVSSSNPLVFRSKLASQIKGINNKLDQITKDMDRFHLKTIIPSSAHGQENIERRSRQTTSFANQSQIVGREGDKDKLIKILTTVTTASSSTSLSNNLEKELPVVSIVGMGGLGKTTLAQLVYNDDSVNRYFEPKIWVCVSDDFDVYRLLSYIMESITQEKFSDLSNFDVLVRKVREQLAEKRFLLVLDDLWNEDAEQWGRLQSSLTVGAEGCKILVTTRKRQVADVVKGSISPYFLEKLRADECWSIMERKAFSPGGALKTPNMDNIGKEIANKCSGLPLAAKFLGSLMHSKNKESNWLSIRDDDMWNGPAESKIIPVLKCSYDNLSPHLQRCFSYCSIFPKDRELSKQTLIQLWMAEGFLQPFNDCSFEDVGDEYFESLMWSSFFDGVEKNELDDVMTFKMHDLVHDLAQAVVGDHECLTVKVTDQLEKISEVRRLNLIMDKEFSASSKFISNTKLRTFIVLERNYDSDLRGITSNKHLRVLHLGDRGKDRSRIEYTTSKLRQLRYFYISYTVLLGFGLGDDLIRRLYNLQTLVLSGCTLVPDFVKKIGFSKHLRHLDISFTDIEELPDSVTSLQSLQRLDLNNCKKFTHFADSVTGLSHLKYLDMSCTLIEKLPGFVTSLRDLHTLDVSSCKYLKALPEYVAGLRNLRIFNFKNCPWLETLPKDFGALTQLRSLNLDGTRIKVLPESCIYLRNLEYVHLFQCQLPNEVTHWVKLRKFYYTNSKTPMGIGKLTWLQELMYDVREKVINNEPECNDGIEELANLNFLEMLSIANLQNVKDPVDAERANLKGKQNLIQLELYWECGETEEDLSKSWWDEKSCNFQVFEALQPPPSLTYLQIQKFMGREFPTWMCDPSGPLLTLEHLVLQNCKGMKQLPAAIRKLPRLWRIELEGMSMRSLNIGGFPALTRLDLTDMLVLEELCDSYPSCLEDLNINGCRSLKEIPSLPLLMSLVLEKTSHDLVSSVGRSQTSLTQLFLENIEELTYFPLSILVNNCNLRILQIENCNQFQGFAINDDENESVAPLLAPDHYSGFQNLELIGCPVLKFLPDLRGWTSLERLLIFKCPQVEGCLTYDLKSLSFLKLLFVDYIQEREQQRGYPLLYTDLISLVVDY
ncbi:disease resistance protein RGA2-like [Papaver somniferum]|uniref:disease resistance protein RGA2-like n=1 Tax=Papaver somniferum TaxID=3469 RepID=UPI000E6F9313|nr:disease resistance protein RGA2-like [Papaver somniferum]